VKTIPLFAASFSAGDAGVFAAVVVLLGISSVLALAETSLVRTSKARARALEEAGHHGAKSLVKLVEEPEKFLTPVLLLVLICQMVIATLVASVASNLFGPLGVAAALLFEIVFIFVAAEAVPKDWAVRNADRAALFSAPIVTALIKFPPVRLVASGLIGLARVVTRGDDDGEDQPEMTESELLALTDIAVDELVLEREERALITSIIEFGDTIVREVMAPRPDIVAVEAASTASAVLERAISSGLSRIPVYAKSVDDVIGIAYTKDLMRAVREGGDEQPVAGIARKAHYVPETKRVAPLLREMQAEQFHLAVVVDEYGGTAGIVTLEDLIEELVGEIADEFDVDEPLVEPLSDHEYRLSGKMPVDEVNELLGTDLPVGDWDTVGGLFLHLRGQVPVEGEQIDSGGNVLVAEKVQGRRIGSVRITTAPKIEEPAERAEAEA